MLHGNHTLPLSFTICRLRQLESVTPGPPALQDILFDSAQSPRLLNSSTCQPWPGSLSLPAEHSQPALLPGLGQPPHCPGAHSYSRATHQTPHSGLMETSASLLPLGLGSAFSPWGLRDAENVIILRELQVLFSVLILAPLGGCCRLYPARRSSSSSHTTTGSLLVPREVSGFREMK